MPHKHKRDKSHHANASFYDLPPTTIACPLPVLKSTTTHTKNSKPLRVRPKHRSKARKLVDDDTPRAFARLMAGQKPPRGLDDGPPLSKKRKGNAPSITHITSSDQPKPSINVPEILPFEPLSSFSARVDAALPISGLSRSKGKVDPVDGKARQTKLEKRMQKMQQEWREADQRRKAQAADDEADSDDWSSRAKVPGKRNPRGKLKRRTTTAGEKEDDDDPWSVLTTKRLETSLPATSAPSSGLVGLHDVVLAPPKLKIPRETMKKRLHGGGAGKGVLGGATGMRRQAELGEEAIKVVEGYRRMMAGKTEG